MSSELEAASPDQASQSDGSDDGVIGAPAFEFGGYAAKILEKFKKHQGKRFII